MTLKKFENATITGYFGICVWGKLCQGNHVIIVTSSFSESSVFKVCSVHWFEERFPKAPFLSRISVDCKPNHRSKAEFEKWFFFWRSLNVPWVTVKFVYLIQLLSKWSSCNYVTLHKLSLLFQNQIAIAGRALYAAARERAKREFRQRDNEWIFLANSMKTGPIWYDKGKALWSLPGN